MNKNCRCKKYILWIFLIPVITATGMMVCFHQTEHHYVYNIHLSFVADEQSNNRDLLTGDFLSELKSSIRKACIHIEKVRLSSVYFDQYNMELKSIYEIQENEFKRVEVAIVGFLREKGFSNAGFLSISLKEQTELRRLYTGLILICLGLSGIYCQINKKRQRGTYE